MTNQASEPTFYKHRIKNLFFRCQGDEIIEIDCGENFIPLKISATQEEAMEYRQRARNFEEVSVRIAPISKSIISFIPETVLAIAKRDFLLNILLPEQSLSHKSDHYLFEDPYHPSTTFHRHLMKEIYYALEFDTFDITEPDISMPEVIILRYASTIDMKIPFAQSDVTDISVKEFMSKISHYQSIIFKKLNGIKID